MYEMPGTDVTIAIDLITITDTSTHASPTEEKADFTVTHNNRQHLALQHLAVLFRMQKKKKVHKKHERQLGFMCSNLEGSCLGS